MSALPVDNELGDADATADESGVLLPPKLADACAVRLADAATRLRPKLAEAPNTLRTLADAAELARTLYPCWSVSCVSLDESALRRHAILDSTLTLTSCDPTCGQRRVGILGDTLAASCATPSATPSGSRAPYSLV